MPDERHHRGAHPEDQRLFGPESHAALRSAVADLSWLLSRSYATPSALKLVGDRYGLDQRQRVAVMRAACSDEARIQRQGRQVAETDVQGHALLLDGYNVLTTIEAALGHGVILACRDGCFRDMASIHGTYRKVDETPPALRLIGQVAAGLGIGRCVWYLDSPVSNSGRLKGVIEEIAAREKWDWRVEVVLNPDPVLWQSAGIVATADSVVLDRCGPWLNLARLVVERRTPDAWLVDLQDAAPAT